jgi:hypothetical protein
MPWGELPAWRRLIESILIYEANGGLLILYWLWGAAPLLISLASAALCLVYFDRELYRKTALAGGRGTPMVPQWTTAVAIALWLVASLLYSSPVPQIGALMWLGLLVALLMAPHERPGVMWRSKTYIISYSLLLLAFRFYLWQVDQMTATGWAALLGSTGTAEQAVLQNRSMITTVGLWLLWAVVPLGYFSLLFQRLTVTPMSLVSPLRSASEIIRDLRTRREAS